MTIEAPRACILGDIAEASLHESFGSADVRSPALQTSHGRLKELRRSQRQYKQKRRQLTS